MKKKIALVRLSRGVFNPLHSEKKIMSFICDLDDVEKGDLVVVEVNVKTKNRNKANDYRIGQVIDFITFSDGEIAMFRPNNYIMFKVYNDDFLNRSYTILRKKYSLFARYKAISNKNNEKPRYSIFDDIIKETDNLQFQRLTSWEDALKIDKEHTNLDKETRLCSIKLQKGSSGKENNKPFIFVCDLKNVKKNDYVVVEIKRKNVHSRRTNDYRIGRIDEVFSWSDEKFYESKPTSFVVWKLENINYKQRCVDVKQQKRMLWEMYNLDKGKPDKKPEGVPMNLFDHCIDPNGTLHLDRLPKYQVKKGVIKKQPLNKKKRKSKKIKNS